MDYKEVFLNILSSILHTPIKLAYQIWLFLSWEQITKYLKSKFISSSYIFIILIPVIANISSKVPNTIEIYEIELIMRLPFSWFYLYFGAVSFFCAKILYLFIAPKIYSDNLSYDDFEKKGRNREHLKLYANDGYFVNFDFHKKYDDSLENIDTDTKTLFWNLWNDLNYELKFRRIILSCLVFIGYFVSTK